eukprot:scaffold494_cov117-Isochrysis_galbana.AAC.6
MITIEKQCAILAHPFVLMNAPARQAPASQRGAGAGHTFREPAVENPRCSSSSRSSRSFSVRMSTYSSSSMGSSVRAGAAMTSLCKDNEPPDGDDIRMGSRTAAETSAVRPTLVRNRRTRARMRPARPESDGVGCAALRRAGSVRAVAEDRNCGNL